MRDYVIVADATSDLPAKLYDDLNILVIPMEYELSKKAYVHYPDARELSCSEFYRRLRDEEIASTSQINVQTYEDFFAKIVSSGKNILYIAFSTGLSGTLQSAIIAAEEVKEKFPGSEIFCVDSKSASVGEGQLIFNAARQKEKGLSLSELKAWVEENRTRFCHWFTVDDLHFLHRGGRVSAAAAIVGTAIGIKPVLHVDNDGHLIPVSKVRGRKKSLEALVEHMEKTCIHPEEQTIFIGHGDNLEDALYVKKMVEEKFKVQDIIVTDIGPVIGAHSGPDTIALFFFGTER